jgi:serine/threonine protein kinase
VVSQKVNDTFNYKTETLGTIPWMAPEFLREKTFDSSSDVFSFGVALWELICEKQPHSQMMPV